MTYFVTFRLDDSIPADLLKDWLHDRETWLAAHGTSGRHMGKHRSRAMA